jgi:hypothetical protein
VGLAANELERRGIATVALQLLHRGMTDAERPPRGLWVPFWHGYALGAPDDPAGQRVVLDAALEMLDDAALTAPAWRDLGPAER